LPPCIFFQTPMAGHRDPAAAYAAQSLPWRFHLLSFPPPSGPPRFVFIFAGDQHRAASSFSLPDSECFSAFFTSPSPFFTVLRAGVAPVWDTLVRLRLAFLFSSLGLAPHPRSDVYSCFPGFFFFRPRSGFRLGSSSGCRFLFGGILEFPAVPCGLGHPAPSPMFQPSF